MIEATPPGPAGLLDQPVQYMKGVGPRRAEALARLGVRTARDLLFLAPRRYEDASTITPIGSLEVGAEASAIGTVVSKGVLPTRSGLRIFQAVIRDATGMIECSWPGQPYLDRVIRAGDVLLVSGPVRFFHGRQLQPREQVVLGSGEGEGDVAGVVLPVYPATEGLSQRLLRRLIEGNLDRLLPALDAEEVFERRELAAAGCPDLRTAIESLHRPADLVEAAAARRRLAYGELFFLQLLHARTRAEATRARPGIRFGRTDRLIAPLYRQLPFRLTDAQARVLREIYADMEGERRMYRLLQGDVGTGKTVVALFATLLAIESGYQAAIMAPTEILAEQHARTLRELLGNLGPRVVLLTGAVTGAARREALDALRTGAGNLAVGTHALIQDRVDFARLGLVVIDEQHRFGVRQRLALAARGDGPDVLVMSATPIPRSLALTLYGDLDLSLLDERPPGRRPVRTGLRGDSGREAVYDFVRAEARAGRQAYIVFPLVEESDKVELRAATAEFERLAGEVFPDLRVGLLHGQLTGAEKERTMAAFVAGDIDVLVTTTVVEVGVDVPNASVMVVEHAERFGLSQLHQLRGRIGRGAAESYCVLIASGGEDAARRLRVLVETEDGFAVARADLRLRGMGDFFGDRQHGVPEFRFFDPELDLDLLEEARAYARRVAVDDPDLTRPENARFRRELEGRYGERVRLFETG